VVPAIIAAAVSIFVFTVGYVTEGRRARRRRLDEEAVNAAIAFVAAASKRRRQLGVLDSMSKRPSLAGKKLFQLDPPPEDVGSALASGATADHQGGWRVCGAITQPSS